jgi:hypothetical protein
MQRSRCLYSISALLFTTLGICQVGAGRTNPKITVVIQSIKQTGFGAEAEVQIKNSGTRPVFLPQSPYWHVGSDETAINTLAIEQWSDGKTNLLKPGRSIFASSPVEPGFYSVGPCHDIPWQHRWIRLAPGQLYSTQIAAFEPGEGYIVSSCPWIHAHLAGKIRVQLTAYTAKVFSDPITISSEPVQYQPDRSASTSRLLNR